MSRKPLTTKEKLVNARDAPLADDVGQRPLLGHALETNGLATVRSQRRDEDCHLPALAGAARHAFRGKLCGNML